MPEGWSKNSPKHSEIVSVHIVSRELGVNLRTIIGWCRDGLSIARDATKKPLVRPDGKKIYPQQRIRIQHMKVGRSFLTTRADVMAFIREYQEAMAARQDLGCLALRFPSAQKSPSQSSGRKPSRPRDRR